MSTAPLKAGFALGFAAKRIAALIAEHGDPLAALDRVPRSATEVYYRWTGADAKQSLTRRQRNERRALAHYLTHLSERGRVTRRVITDNGRTLTAFWTDEGER